MHISNKLFLSRYIKNSHNSIMKSKTWEHTFRQMRNMNGTKAQKKTMLLAIRGMQIKITIRDTTHLLQWIKILNWQYQVLVRAENSGNSHTFLVGTTILKNKLSFS